MQILRRRCAVHFNFLIFVLVGASAVVVLALKEIGGIEISAHPIAAGAGALLIGFLCALLQWAKKHQN